MSDIQPGQQSPEDARSSRPSARGETAPRTAPGNAEPHLAKGLTTKGRVRSTRAGGAWVSIIIVAVLVIAMLVFIGQNSQKVTLNFLAFDGRVPLGLALLFAAVAGILLVAIPGTARIIELRRALRRNEQDKQVR